MSRRGDLLAARGIARCAEPGAATSCFHCHVRAQRSRITLRAYVGAITATCATRAGWWWIPASCLCQAGGHDESQTTTTPARGRLYPCPCQRPGPAPRIEVGGMGGCSAIPVRNEHDG